MEELFKKLSIKPKDLRLYNTAFSHSSYANEHKAKGDYEKLFPKEQTSNYVVVEKVKKKPQFCSKRRGFVFLKK